MRDARLDGPQAAHCWLSDAFSVPSETLCLDSPESPNSDYVCCKARGHAGAHQYRWMGDTYPAFRARSWKDQPA